MNKFLPQRILIVLVFFWNQVFIPLGELNAQTSDQSLCQTLLNEAQQEYYNGNFETAIEIIKRCLLEDNITENERFRAYKILAQTYIAKDYSDAAIQVVRKLLEMNPDYAPTIEQEPPQFVNLVAKIKA
jgi:tetratricopeptide (TPR) repeat protein